MKTRPFSINLLELILRFLKSSIVCPFSSQSILMKIASTFWACLSSCSLQMLLTLMILYNISYTWNYLWLVRGQGWARISTLGGLKLGFSSPISWYWHCFYIFFDRIDDYLHNRSHRLWNIFFGIFLTQLPPTIRTKKIKEKKVEGSYFIRVNTDVFIDLFVTNKIGVMKSSLDKWYLPLQDLSLRRAPSLPFCFSTLLATGLT